MVDTQQYELESSTKSWGTLEKENSNVSVIMENPLSNSIEEIVPSSNPDSPSFKEALSNKKRSRTLVQKLINQELFSKNEIDSVEIEGKHVFKVKQDALHGQEKKGQYVERILVLSKEGISILDWEKEKILYYFEWIELKRFKWNLSSKIWSFGVKSEFSDGIESYVFKTNQVKKLNSLCDKYINQILQEKGLYDRVRFNITHEDPKKNQKKEEDTRKLQEKMEKKREEEAKKEEKKKEKKDNMKRKTIRIGTEVSVHQRDDNITKRGVVQDIQEDKYLVLIIGYQSVPEWLSISEVDLLPNS